MGVTFSIVIPTKNRHETLAFCIESCLRQRYDNAQFIVCDNFSTPQTKETVGQFSDPRLVYSRSDKRLSQTENFERAFTLAKGDYICFLGDDDALMPNALDALAKAIEIESNPDVIVSPMADYWWPGTDQITQPLQRIENTLHFEALGARSAADRDTSKMYADFLGGKRGYRGMPGFYHKFARREKLESLTRHGRLIHSVSPDLYVALCLMATSSSIMYHDSYLVLGGMSNSSVGLSCFLAEIENPLVKQVYEETISEAKEALHPYIKNRGSLSLAELECFFMAQETGIIPKPTTVDLSAWVNKITGEALASPISRTIQTLEDLLETLERLSKADSPYSSMGIAILGERVKSLYANLSSPPPTRSWTISPPSNTSKTSLSSNVVDLNSYCCSDILYASVILAVLADCQRHQFHLASDKASLLESELRRLHDSLSWRITKPLRILSTLKSRLMKPLNPGTE
jgi:glycosyltransferase involved in cell wall biosynthesis